MNTAPLNSIGFDLMRFDSIRFDSSVRFDCEVRTKIWIGDSVVYNALSLNQFFDNPHCIATYTNVLKTYWRRACVTYVRNTYVTYGSSIYVWGRRLYTYICYIQVTPQNKRIVFCAMKWKTQNAPKQKILFCFVEIGLRATKQNKIQNKNKSAKNPEKSRQIQVTSYKSCK